MDAARRPSLTLVKVGFGPFSMGVAVRVHPVEDGADNRGRLARIGAHNGESLCENRLSGLLIPGVGAEVDIKLSFQVYDFPGKAAVSKMDWVLNFDRIIRRTDRALTGSPGLIKGVVRLSGIHKRQYPSCVFNTRAAQPFQRCLAVRVSRERGLHLH